MLLPYIVVVFAILVFVIYPILYGKRVENKPHLGIDNGDISNKDVIINREISRIKKIVSIIINHIQLKRALFSITKDYTTPIVVGDYDIVPSNEKTQSLSTSNTIQLQIWDEEMGRIHDSDKLITEVLEELSIMIGGNVEDTRRELLKTAKEMKYISH